MSKNERVISDPEAAGWEFDVDTGYWMWKGEEGTGGGLWEANGDDIYYDKGNVGIGTGVPSARGIVAIQGNTGAPPRLDLDNTLLGGRMYSLYSGGTYPGNFAVYDATAAKYRFEIDAVGDATFSGKVKVEGNRPVSTKLDLISTLVTLRKATMDETQDIRESLRAAIDELVDGFEQEIAAMPAPEPEVGTMDIKQ